MKISTALKNLFSTEKAYLNEYVFEKKDKIIHFQEMAHVAHESTYMEINKSIHSFLNKHMSGKIYIEGVHGDDKSRDLLNKKMMEIMGIKLLNPAEKMHLKAIYKAIAYITGGKVQGDDNYLKGVNEAVRFKADVTCSHLYKSIKHINKKEEVMKLDLSKERLDKLKFKKLIGFATKKTLKGMLRNKEQSLFMSNSSYSMQQLKEVILYDRNMILVDMLDSSNDKEIFVTYGAAHYHGVKEEMLKKGYVVKLVKQIEYN